MRSVKDVEQALEQRDVWHKWAAFDGYTTPGLVCGRQQKAGPVGTRHWAGITAEQRLIWTASDWRLCPDCYSPKEVASAEARREELLNAKKR